MGKFLSQLFGGEGIGGKLIGAVKDYFPPKATPEERANLEMAIQAQAHEIEMAINQVDLEQQMEHNRKIKDLEGTANDLNQFGWIGKVVIFLRGLQRPMWGFMVMWLDVMLYSGKWTMPEDDQMRSAFWVINFLVLGFLFGERAVKNIIPLVSTYLGKGSGKA